MRFSEQTKVHVSTLEPLKMKTAKSIISHHNVNSTLLAHASIRHNSQNKFKKFNVSASDLPLIIKTKNAPIHLYATEVEEKAMSQVYALANSDIPVGPVAIMPDVHWGKGSVVGAVFANKTKICPMAVGVDIGCGMTAIKMKGIQKHTLSSNRRLMKNIQNSLKSKIPVGFNAHQRAPHNAWKTVHGIAKNAENCHPSNWLHRYIQREQIIQLQLGTLGGGNHFIEVLHEDLTDHHTSKQQQQGARRSKYDGNEESDVWLMLHSGSRVSM